MKQVYLLSVFLLAFAFVSNAQKNHRDSSIFIPTLGMNYSYHLVGGDMANTFGNNSAVGADFTLKFKSQWIVGTSFEYYFSDKVNNQELYFKDITNEKGYIIDGNGQFAEVFLFERGFNIQIFGGYQFDFWSPNPNSGPFIQVGMGFMQYWVRIENPGFTAPQIKDEYKKLYDRLSNGFSTTQFFGYRLMGSRNLTNFYFGIELTQAWTQNRRSYNADLSAADPGRHFDMLTGFKVGWIIPFYAKAPKQYYYY